MGILKKNQHPHLARYYHHIDSLPASQQALTDFQSVSRAKGKSKGPSATFELGLPNAVHGQVVTRFPPEPSGYLHIGHAKAALLNQHFAQQYDGKMLIRFDDTNPSKEKAEFQDAIMEDCELMGIKPDKVSYTSDYFDDLFKHAVNLIKRSRAYTDDTLQEQMREERMNGIASKHRDDSIEDNLAHFAAMQTGSEDGLRWCLRAKISVDNPNKAMRDPVIYRCNLEPHHRTGTTWKIYPGYDFACPIVVSYLQVCKAVLILARTLSKASHMRCEALNTAIDYRNINGCLPHSTYERSKFGNSVGRTLSILCSRSGSLKRWSRAA